MTGAVRGERTEELTARVDRLAAALQLAGDRFDPAVTAEASAAVARVRERLALGVDHTVVALVGGTGSGKSSLFNAVCGLPFAEVGAQRPTTSQVSACVWGADGDPLLDWLGVAADRRIRRDSALDAEAESGLRGLVLLDLPDHDSVEPAHREVVERLLPMADLLVWVVDPQKYADDALHSRYLRGLGGHEQVMLVVLNQVDTVPPEARELLVSDVARVLAVDGLHDVGVRVASARTGDGVGSVRDRLADAVQTHGLAGVRAEAEIADLARLLRTQVTAEAPEPAGLDPVVDRLVEAAGVPTLAAGVADGVEAAAPRTRADAASQARREWLDLVAWLPERWRSAVDAAVGPAERLRAAVDDALAEPGPVARGSAARVLALVGLAALVVAGGAGALAAGRAAGGGAIEPAWLPVAAAGCAVVAVLSLVAAVLARGMARRRVAARALAFGRGAVERVVRELMGDPTAEVVEQYLEAQRLVRSAGD